MTIYRSCAAVLFATTAVVPVLAQETPPLGEDYIGDVTVGGSLRGVQTEVAAPATTISQEELDARQASSMSQLIDTVPGVTLVNGSSPQGSAVSIRGLGSQAGVYGTDNKVSVVVNGVAKGAEEIYRNGGLFTMEPELFREVTVVRGPSDGFRYSSGAIGGTIEAQTKLASDFLEGDDTFAIRQKFGYESNGSDNPQDGAGGLSTSILAWRPLENVDILAFYGYRVKGDYVNGDGETVKDSKSQTPAYLLQATYGLSDALTFQGFYSFNENAERDVSYDSFGGLFSQQVNRDTLDTTAYGALQFNPADNDWIDGQLKLLYTKEEIAIDPATDTAPSPIYYSDHISERVGLILENTSRFSTGPLDHQLLMGLDIGERTRTSESLDTDGDGDIDNDPSAPGGTDEYIAVYATDQIQIGKLTATPQIRYEKQTLTSDNNAAYVSRGAPQPAVEDGTRYKNEALTGALALRYALTDAFAVFGTYAYNENMPILDDLRSDFAGQAETGTTVELGFSYDQVALLSADDALKLKVTGYETTIDDGTTYSGIDEVELTGVEVELSYVFGDWYTDVNGAWARGKVVEDTDGGTPDPDYFNYVAADNARWTVGRRFMNKQLDLSAEAYHVFENDRTTSTDEESATGPSDDYTTFSLGAAYLPKSGALDGFEFRASVDNLTNETVKPYLSSYDIPGRTFKISVAKTF